ncbi:MAG: cytochrome-c peroxidase [Ignavibacteria bacterium]
MKKTLFLLVALLCTTIVISMKQEELTLPEKVRIEIMSSIDSMQISLSSFEKGVKQQVNTTLLKYQFAQVRASYKQFEWFLGHIEPESAQLINGPPLPRLDESVPSIMEIEPEGLQVMEEILNEDVIDYPALTYNIQKLKQHIVDAKNLIQTTPLSDRIILEAVRNNIIRIGTLGISGFDTPGFSDALKESTISWESAGKALSYYAPLFQRTSKIQSDSLELLLQKGRKILSASRSFDAFDRWGFTKDYINPVYTLIGSLHIQSGIEINTEVSRKNRIIRYETPTLYHTSAYDPYGYARNKYERPSQSKIDLGAMLFRSTDLSKSGTMSCATCHDPQRAFMDGHAKSPGSVPHSFTDRNTPGLLNVALSPRYFHDSRTTFLEEQIEHVVSSSIEFNTDYFEIAQRLSQEVKIVDAFKSAYPSESGPISATTISSALSAYIRSLVSFETPVDSLLRGQKSKSLTGNKLKQVKNGFNLFMGKAACGTCHFPPTFSGLVPPHFTDMESEVLGVPTHPTSKRIDPDLGKGGIYKYKSPIYAHAFKTPGLRNVRLTAPYMHNGAYKTLEEVMDFYNRGGGIGLGIDVPNQTLPSDKLKLTKQEISDVIAFMKALAENPKY